VTDRARRIAAAFWIHGATLAWAFVTLWGGLGVLASYVMTYVYNQSTAVYLAWPRGGASWVVVAVAGALVAVGLAYLVTRWLRAPRTVWIGVPLGALVAWGFLVGPVGKSLTMVFGGWATTDLLIGLVCTAAAYVGASYGAAAAAKSRAA
jgi:hypothetical protein